MLSSGPVDIAASSSILKHQVMDSIGSCTPGTQHRFLAGLVDWPVGAKHLAENEDVVSTLMNAFHVAIYVALSGHVILLPTCYLLFVDDGRTASRVLNMYQCLPKKSSERR
jgi:hypothetical protein